MLDNIQSYKLYINKWAKDSPSKNHIQKYCEQLKKYKYLRASLQSIQNITKNNLSTLNVLKMDMRILDVQTMDMRILNVSTMFGTE